MMKSFLEVTLRSAGFLEGIVPPSEIRATITEFRNKLQAFYLFEHIDSVLLLSGANLTLTEMIGRAFSLGPFFSVWAMEGIGHYYTQLQIAINEAPRGLLRGDHALDLCQQSLVPLHAGMGLALSEAWLAQHRRTGARIDDFFRLCEENARQAYLGAAVEALGLVARTLHPDLIGQMDREFSQHNQEMLAYFWHGVGRGIYFLPSNSLPLWGYDMCLQEPPHRLGKLNAAAGYAWALTLVNLRQPEVIAAFIHQQQPKISGNDAFANGVFSALVIWLESASEASSLATLCNYQPGWLDPSLPALWDAYVRPCGAHALDFHRNPATHIGDLFRYRPMSD